MTIHISKLKDRSHFIAFDNTVLRLTYFLFTAATYFGVHAERGFEALPHSVATRVSNNCVYVKKQARMYLTQNLTIELNNNMDKR